MNDELERLQKEAVVASCNDNTEVKALHHDLSVRTPLLLCFFCMGKGGGGEERAHKHVHLYAHRTAHLIDARPTKGLLRSNCTSFSICYVETRV